MEFKITYKQALLSFKEPVSESPTLCEDEMPPLEEIPTAETASVKKVEYTAPRKVKKKVPKMRGNKRLEVKCFTPPLSRYKHVSIFTDIEHSKTVYKRIVIEEVDDDSDDEDGASFTPEVEVLTKTQKRRLKRWRRRDRRFEAQQKALDKEIAELRLIRSFIELQSGTRTGETPVQYNLRRFNELGLKSDEVKAIDVSFKLSERKLRRLKRDVIQRRSAALKEQFAKLEVEHAVRQRFHDMERKQAREWKFEQQGSGHVISAVAVGSLAFLTRRLSRFLNKTEQKADSLMSGLTDAFKEVASKLGKFGVVIRCSLVATILYYLWDKFKNPIVRALLLPIAAGTVPEARDFLLDFFQKSNEKHDVEQQSGIGTGSIAMLLSLLVTYLTGVRGKANIMSAVVEAVSKLPRLSKGVDTLITYALKVVEAGVNVVGRWFNKPEFRFRQRFQKEVNDVIVAAWALDKKISAKDFDAKESPGVYAECMNCFANTVRLIAIHREDVATRLELIQVRAMLSSHCASLRSTLGRGAGYRCEPLSVVIESAPGVGKTMQTPVLISTVLKRSGIMPDLNEENSHEAFFTRPANSDYFDGYYGQECYLIDDLFAIRPVPGKVSHFEDIMAFYGSVTTMLNMAECDKKGQYPFTSSLLLMTTNIKDLTEVGAAAILVEPSAFRRRFDIHVHVAVRPEYVDASKPGQIDYAAYERECDRLLQEGKTGMDAHPWYMWEAWDTTFGPQPTFIPGTGQCFSTVVTRMIDGLMYKKRSHARAMSHLRAVLQAGDIVRFTTDSDDGPLDNWYTMQDERDKLDEFPVNIEKISGCGNPQTFRSRLRESIPECVRASSREIQKYFVYGSRATQTLFSTVLDAAIGFFEHEWHIYAATAVAACVFTIIATLRTGKFPEEQSNGPTDKPVMYRRPPPAVQQNGTSITLQDRIFNQSYKILVAVGEDGLMPLGQMIFVAGNISVMPYHYFQHIDELKSHADINDSTEIIMVPCNGSSSVVKSTVGAFLSYDKFVVDGDDLVFVNFKRGFRLFPDIAHHCLKESEIATVSGRQVRLDVGNVVDGDNFTGVCSKMGFVSMARYGNTMLRTDKRNYRRWVEYDCTTSKGDCGSMLFLLDSKYYACRTLIGIHVAGSPSYGKGYSTPLTFEIVEKAKKRFSYSSVKEATHLESAWPSDIEVQAIDVLPFTVDGTFGCLTPLAVVNKPVSAPIKSSMVRTAFGKEQYFDECIELINDGNTPAKLVPMKMGPHYKGDALVYPMEEALKPFAGDLFLPAKGIFTLPLSMALKPFAEASRFFSGRTLTWEEAIIGNNLLGLKSITRGTSTGYPLCLFAKDKKYFFGNGDDFDLTTPEALDLLRDLDQLDSLLMEDVRPFFMCRDFLKDETRKEGKDARLIAGTDLRYYILCRKYFGAFVGSVCRTHMKSGMCLGMNPYAEWGELRRFVTRPDPRGINVWDGDFAGFDSSQMPSLLWECLDYINDWYEVRGGTPEESRIRELLFMDLVYSRHITSFYGQATTIVEWSKSLPSGHFLTSTINSMLSMGLIASGFLHLTGKTDFWTWCSAATLGDDNIVCTSDDCIKDFNQVTLSKHLKDQYGMIYTAGRKGEELQPAVGIDNVIFLQRRFAVKEGHDVCPIRPESFLQSLYYVRTNDNAQNRETLLAGIELALEELSMHDEKFWKHVSGALSEAKFRLGSVPHHATRNSSLYLELVRGRVPTYI